MKSKNSTLTFVLLIGLTFAGLTNARSSTIRNVTGILNEISNLSSEFNLSNHQKAQMRSVLMDYLPGIALKASAMLNNRKDLLSISTGQDALDEDTLLRIAEKQGQLLTQLIVIKEHLKKDIRMILTEDQKEFVDELIETIIQYRLNS